MYTAAPPDVLRVDEKNIKEYEVPNLCRVIITTNHKTAGIYLPPDDRRHFVAWSECTKNDFTNDYWTGFYRWLDDGGRGHVAAFLAAYGLSAFNPKAPPPHTPAFWSIVDANQAPEDAELADVLNALGDPDAVTLDQIARRAGEPFNTWLTDRKNRRSLLYRMEVAGYVRVRNDDAKDGLWRINGKRQVIYARAALSNAEQLAATQKFVGSSIGRCSQ